MPESRQINLEQPNISGWCNEQFTNREPGEGWKYARDEAQDDFALNSYSQAIQSGIRHGVHAWVVQNENETAWACANQEAQCVWHCWRARLSRQTGVNLTRKRSSRVGCLAADLAGLVARGNNPAALSRCLLFTMWRGRKGVRRVCSRPRSRLGVETF